MKLIGYIFVFLFATNFCYAQKHNKARRACDKKDLLISKEILLNAKVNRRNIKLSDKLSLCFIDKANEYIATDAKQALKYLTHSQVLTSKFRNDSWTTSQIETGLNIAYKLKTNCEKNFDSSSTCYTKSKDIYESILQSDPYNWSANYNLGSLLYKRAVFKIKKLDYETDIFEIEKIQDECIRLFFSALPYLKNAYNANPQEELVVKSLSDLYFSLNNETKAVEYELLIKD